VTVTVVVVSVVVVVGLAAVLEEGGSAATATVVVGVPAGAALLVVPRLAAGLAVTGAAPRTSAAHQATVDVRPNGSARAIAMRPTGLVHGQPPASPPTK
jgi:hypothetical protein